MQSCWSFEIVVVAAEVEVVAAVAVAAVGFVAGVVYTFVEVVVAAVAAGE